MSLVDDIKKQIDPILEIRDLLGAQKAIVYIVERTWREKIGVGTFADIKTQIYPTPNIVDLSHKFKMKEAGNLKDGDLLLKMVSKNKFPEETFVSCKNNSDKKEMFYLIDNYSYEVISVTSEYVYWNVLIRKTNRNKGA
jgi:hypothetical protein